MRILEVLLGILLGVMIGIFIGSNIVEYRIQDWSPGMPWKVFMAEEGHGEIIDVYIRDELLWIVGEDKEPIPHILNIEKRKYN